MNNATIQLFNNISKLLYLFNFSFWMPRSLVAISDLIAESRFGVSAAGFQVGWLLGTKGITSSNKKLLGTSALLVVTMFATRNKCHATRSKDATRGAPGLTSRNKDATRSKGHRYVRGSWTPGQLESSVSMSKWCFRKGPHGEQSCTGRFGQFAVLVSSY